MAVIRVALQLPNHIHTPLKVPLAPASLPPAFFPGFTVPSAGPELEWQVLVSGMEGEWTWKRHVLCNSQIQLPLSLAAITEEEGNREQIALH